jgi:glycosyltransferase involved in cell wall biosynthesis
VGKKSLALKPLVSILVNNFNYGRFLGQAIDSALVQSCPSVEVIVVDDGSTDNSREVIQSYGERIIPVFKPNGGQASAFNAGFAASKGDWILFLDADDWFAPEKAETILLYASRFRSAGLIAHSLSYCDAENRPLAPASVSSGAPTLVDDRKRARQGKLRVTLPATSALAFNRETLSQILPMPERSTAVPGPVLDQADNYIKFAALSLTPVLLLPELLATQRIHGENLYTGLGHRSEVKPEWQLVRARVAFHLKDRYPFLARLAWKQYGRILFQLSSSGSPDAKRIRRQIRSEYSFFEYSPLCWFYISGAFVKSLVRNALKTQEDQ